MSIFCVLGSNLRNNAAATQSIYKKQSHTNNNSTETH